MANKAEQPMDDLFTLTKSVFIEFPSAGIRWGWGVGTEEDMTETAWKGYDAGVRLAANALDNLYRSPLYNTVLRSAAPMFLRWQQVSKAMIGAAGAGLWQAVGLPTRTEMRALHDAVLHLGTELRTQRQENEALISLATRIVQALEEETPVTPPSVFNGFVLNEQMSQQPVTSPSDAKGN